MNTQSVVADHSPQSAIRNPQFGILPRPQSAIRNVVAGGLMVAIAFTALALGTVEAWSVAIFELIIVVLIVLWAAKAIVDKRLEIWFPPAAHALGDQEAARQCVETNSNQSPLRGSDRSCQPLPLPVSLLRVAAMVR